MLDGQQKEEAEAEAEAEGWNDIDDTLCSLYDREIMGIAGLR